MHCTFNIQNIFGDPDFQIFLHFELAGQMNVFLLFLPVHVHQLGGKVGVDPLFYPAFAHAARTPAPACRRDENLIVGQGLQKGGPHRGLQGLVGILIDDDLGITFADYPGFHHQQHPHKEHDDT